MAPPDTGNPYDFVAAGAPNPGCQGVVVGWDAVRYLHAVVLPQAWQDLDAVRFATGLVLV